MKNVIIIEIIYFYNNIVQIKRKYKKHELTLRAEISFIKNTAYHFETLATH